MSATDSRAPTLSAIVVTYQGEAWIEACLRSIRAHAGPTCEIVVVDNASSDATLARVRTAAQDARVLTLPDNRGYGAAANVGVRAARAPLCLLLNQDLELESAPAPAIERLAREPALMLVGPRLAFPDGRLQRGQGREHAPARLLASWLVPLGVPFLGPRCARVECDPADYERPRSDLAWISGAALLFRRVDWERLGGMDEGFFLYCEDVDLGRRVRQAGGRVGYEPAFRARHGEASGKPWPGPAALRFTFDGYLRYHAKHTGPRAAQRLRFGLRWIARARWLMHSALAHLLPSTTRRSIEVEKAGAFRDLAARLADARAA